MSDTSRWGWNVVGRMAVLSGFTARRGRPRFVLRTDLHRIVPLASCAWMGRLYESGGQVSA